MEFLSRKSIHTNLDLFRIFFIVSLCLHWGSTTQKRRRTNFPEETPEGDNMADYDSYQKAGAVPLFLPSPTNITVHEGELAVLKCRIQNIGPKTVVWRKADDEFPLTIGKEVFAPEEGMQVDYKMISFTESQWDLQIKNVKQRHEGTYECQISAREIYTQYVYLVVLEPRVYEQGLEINGTFIVDKYKMIHLICNATGAVKAPEDVDWFHQGNRIHTSNPKWSGRTHILKHIPIPGRSYISDLIIERSTMADSGDYICRSSDLTVKSVTVHILDSNKPDPPKRGTKPEITPEMNNLVSAAVQVECSKPSLILVLILLSMWR
ncbi:hypothetical protein CHS0354_010481 [Potamilus streckersoni]|uniref:Ig-like domain-containing protein n=1 Tax=Potamilus streckersoni TaxID=2493646 RepID=A0AAE0VHN8_9BIVA|nr:hypothetical protein CHS0354_010481 [Potamilus streckersoni]